MTSSARPIISASASTAPTGAGWRGDIVSSRIVDRATIEIVCSEALSGAYKLWIGRNDSDGWMADGGGAGYGGTTPCDDGQAYTAVDPGAGLTPGTPSLCEYVPQQAFDFWT